MLRLEELKGRPITEIYANSQGVRLRVYRGRQPDHIEWKKKTHKDHGIEIRELPSPD